jgi:hypothetical protein
MVDKEWIERIMPAAWQLGSLAAWRFEVCLGRITVNHIE